MKFNFKLPDVFLYSFNYIVLKNIFHDLYDRAV